MNARTAIGNFSASASVDAAGCKWRPSGDYALVHPSGWTIARYSVYGEWRYLLWEPIDRCSSRSAAATGNQSHGPFNDVRDAMRLHRDLGAHQSQQEIAA